MSEASFVERTFEVDHKEVVCRFFRPVQDGEDFRCRFEIDWATGTKQRDIWGVDGVQALLLAMETAHAMLLTYREREGKPVTWLEQTRLGLPIADVIRDLDT